MDLKTFIERAKRLCTETTPTILKADEPTGETPMELFITDEHTEYYLALSTATENDRGVLTGLLTLMSIPLFFISLWLALNGKLGSTAWPIVFILLVILPIFIWESTRKLPLPVLFNRRTREVYFDNNGKLFHTPWDNIQAIAYEFKIFGPYVAGMDNAALEILIRRLGEPDNALMLRLGAPMGKNLCMQKSFWEYIRAYMNNGPWFDEHGNHSHSNTFIKEQLATHIRPSGFLDHQRQSVEEQKSIMGGKNYLSPSDAILLAGHALFHPASLMEDLVYKIAKRRARNRWPEIVLERLRPDGPTTRLIDLERERGLDV